MSDDYSKMMAPRASEEIHQGREADATMKPDLHDGMPAPVATAHFDTPPGLTPENLVCMADTRSFVIRDPGTGAALAEFKTAKRLPNGDYYVSLEEAKRAAAVLGGWVPEGAGFSLWSGDPSAPWVDMVEVEPVRRACKHYLRQMTDLSSDRESRFIQRSCLAQRSETGEYVSLRDSALFACSIREPRHLESEALLDGFDDGKMAEAQQKTEMASFDVDAALARENLGVLGQK